MGRSSWRLIIYGLSFPKMFPMGWKDSPIFSQPSPQPRLFHKFDGPKGQASCFLHSRSYYNFQTLSGFNNFSKVLGRLLQLWNLNFRCRHVIGLLQKKVNDRNFISPPPGQLFNLFLRVRVIHTSPLYLPYLLPHKFRVCTNRNPRSPKESVIHAPITELFSAEGTFAPPDKTATTKLIAWT